MLGKSSIVLTFAVALLTAQEKPLPKFEDFPIAEVFKGTPALPLFRTPHQRTFRTRIREAASNGPNFAGHYTIVEWMCGSNCAGTAMVDEKTGEAFDQPFEVVEFPPMFDYVDEFHDAMSYKVDSRLLVLHGCPNQEGCGSYYLEWTGVKFKLLRKLPATERKN